MNTFRMKKASGHYIWHILFCDENEVVKMTERIKDLLYKKYILISEKEREHYIGVEIELPIVNLSGEATNHKLCQEVFCKAVSHFSFAPSKYDKNEVCHEAVSNENGDILSFDCSYNNLEISFGKEKNLLSVKNRFNEYIRFFNTELSESGHIITGMGIHPFYKSCSKDYIPTGRYQMLEGYLKKSDGWKKEGGFHPYSAFGTFASSTQMQLDVNKSSLIETLETFSLLEPIKSLLFANSLMPYDEPRYLLTRDMLWEHSTHGINPRNIGVHDVVPKTVDELLEYISYTSIFCTEREGKYLFFSPIPITEYFPKETIEAEYYENGKYYPYSFKPEVEDLNYLRTYKFLDLTSRGTIEYRSLCTQPLFEAFDAIAFQLGLSEKIHELKEIFESDNVLYHHSFTANELRKEFNKGHQPDFIDEDKLKSLLYRITKLSETGLKERGFGEEKLLKSVFGRIETLSSPAKDMKVMLEKGKSMKDIILAYSQL